MDAYLPTTAAVALVGAWLLLLLAAGRGVFRVRGAEARLVGWAAFVLCIATLHFGLDAEPAGFRMLAFVVCGLLGMKVVVVAQHRYEGQPPLSMGQWLWFALGWLGMRPEAFRAARRPDLRMGRELLADGARSGVLGLLILGAAWAGADAVHPRALAIVVLVGSSLVLHFGFCSALAGLWRCQGVRVEPLFRAPLRATSLTEFWGRRWNLAFSRMTQVAVFRPLSARYGRPFALVAAFTFSGALHEMAISLPVRAGYGGPFAYFVLHAFLVRLERWAGARGLRVRGGWGRAWTIAALVLPLPWLFHEPFMRGVLFPMVGAG